MNKLIKHLEKQGISEDTLTAMKKTDRIKFIPLTSSRERAYEDTALSIGYDVTISQPSLVGRMIDLLQIDSINNILELGTGSAYNASIISKLIPYGHLTTVERVKALGERAKKSLRDKNVTVIIGDATNIKYKHRFDRIIITAEFLSEKYIRKFMNDYAALFAICVFPYDGWLWRYTKCGDSLIKEKIMQVRFVPVLEGTV